MTKVLEEITETEITPQHVEKRLNDWLGRIESLYSQLEGWLPNGYSARRSRTVSMHEEMMQKFRVPPKRLPILEITQGGNHIADIEPRGLWIVGANGRLDMFVGGRHYIIMDTADNFAPPAWVLTPFPDRRSRQPLTQETFRSALSV